MKNDKKKVARKSGKSKKKERSTTGESPKDKGEKWQEFLRRHSQAQKKK